jgi:hypothetical protein
MRRIRWHAPVRLERTTRGLEGHEGTLHQSALGCTESDSSVDRDPAGAPECTSGARDEDRGKVAVRVRGTLVDAIGLLEEGQIDEARAVLRALVEAFEEDREW